MGTTHPRLNRLRDPRIPRYCNVRWLTVEYVSAIRRTMSLVSNNKRLFSNVSHSPPPRSPPTTTFFFLTQIFIRDSLPKSSRVGILTRFDGATAFPAIYELRAFVSLDIPRLAPLSRYLFPLFPSGRERKRERERAFARRRECHYRLPRFSSWPKRKVQV